MKVRLCAGHEFRRGPDVDDIGEVISFAYYDDDHIVFKVLFYGYPGTYQVTPAMVESV